MNTCATCEHWTGIGQYLEGTHGYCRQISGGDENIGNRKAACKYDHDYQLSDVTGGTEELFNGSLVTAPDFGCVLHEDRS